MVRRPDLKLFLIPYIRCPKKKKTFQDLKCCIFNSFVSTDTEQKICAHNIQSINNKWRKIHNVIFSTFDTPSNWKMLLKNINIIWAAVLMVTKICEKYFFDRFSSKLAGIFVCSFAANSQSFIVIKFKMADLAAILFRYPNLPA